MFRYVLLGLTVILFFDQAVAQVTAHQVIEEECSEEEIFTIVEEMPKYPGGDAALLKYIAENLIFPPALKDQGLCGVIYASYIVDSNGVVKDVKVNSNCVETYNAETIRVISSLKGYTPGKQRGKPVPVKFTIPLRFHFH